MSPRKNNDGGCKECGGRVSRLGRKGDPRMHRAVAAKLKDPSMSLLDALRLGGFEFPSGSSKKEGGEAVSEIMLEASTPDSDGVSIQQRKNQLSRRLRIARNAEQREEQVERRQSKVDSIFNKKPASSSRRRSSHPNPCCPSTLPEGLVEEEHESDIKDNTANGKESQQEDDVGRMAKFHPNYRPLFPGTAARDVAASTTSAPASAKECRTHPVVNDSTQQKLPAQDFSSVATLPPSSGLAVASLTSTAASIGLTLEQLAMSLNSIPDLLRVLAASRSPEAKEALCLNLYQLESTALLQKCMILAGFGEDEAADGSPVRMQLAYKGWEREGKRLERTIPINLKQKMLQQQTVQKRKVSSAPSTVGGCHKHARKVGDDDEHSSCEAGHNHHHHHSHAHNGKCHKPVIHKPPGGPPLIDFVVGEKLECYQDMLPPGNDEPVKCPSRCTSKEVKKKNDVDASLPNPQQQQQQTKEPKEFLLSDLNLESNEWNMDWFNTDEHDETLLDLMKLGDSSKDGTSKNNMG